MINEGHISVTAKKDYVLLCATDWKTDLAPAYKASLPFPELRGRLCSAQGEDIRRTEEGGRTDGGVGGGGVTVQGGKGLCQLTLLEAGSLKAAAPATAAHSGEQAGRLIQDLQAGEQVGWSPAETSLPQAIMQSDE